MEISRVARALSPLTAALIKAPALAGGQTNLLASYTLEDKHWR